MLHPNKLLFFCAAALLALPHAAHAQDCVGVETTPVGASVLLRGNRQFAASTPGSICMLERGQSYRLTVAFPGYETRNLDLHLKQDGSISTSGLWFGYTVRSLLVPGLGQMAMGSTARGTWAFLLGGGSAAYLTWAWYNYDQARDRYNATLKLVDSTTSQSDLEALDQQLLIEAQDTNVKHQRLQDVAVLSIHEHANNVAEAFLMARPAKSRVEGSTVKLSVSKLTGTRAMMRSVLFPGLGQKYMGHPGWGWFMQSCFITTTVLAIEWRYDTTVAQNRYENQLMRIEQATTTDEIAAAQRAAAPLWNDYRDKERWRNAFYISMGAVWAWSVVDAAFISDPVTSNGTIGFETSINGSFVETSWTWRF